MAFVNKYGDTLLKVTKGTRELNNYFDANGGYDPSKGYIVHSPSFLGSIVCCSNSDSPMKLVAQTNDVFAYANEAVTKKCPKLINNQVSGSTVVLKVVVGSEKYSIFVKDRTKGYITNPAGTLEYNESFIDCAIRECYEETGLKVQIATTNEIGSFGYNYTLFELQWGGLAKIYETTVELTYAEFGDLLNYQCDEIEKVYAVKNLEKSMKLDNIPISDHHLLASRFSDDKYLHWETETPTYLRDFQLYVVIPK